ncbi:iron uptake transporter permease EfeU [Martelella endophytica]|uniref:Iron permease n=1 Tax=Martelella endophytica TaxID=1486262 RepID=A0A0D5LMG9_MAREN|nr:iron uptake transporter permease EfeU [Martelella endophytica]AJY45384.1 hypothetical protein TM49_06220 [Martelella endophytica]
MLATFIIGLREGLEAALIVGIIAAFLKNNGKSLAGMWIGVVLAVLLSIAVGVGLSLVERALPQAAQEGMEAVIGAIAIIFVTGMIFWMNAHARDMKRQIEAETEEALGRSGTFALAGMAFLAVLKEGFETSVFLLATFSAAQSAGYAAAGAVIGLAASVIVGWGIYAGGIRFNLSKFFQFTGAFLILVAAGLVVTSLRTAHEAGWLNAGQETTVSLAWLVAPGTIRSALITGVLGIPADPRLVEVVGWFAYLVPVSLLVYWPRSHRPGPQAARRLKLAAASGLALAAVLLAALYPKPELFTPATADITASGDSAPIGHIALETDTADKPETLQLTIGGNTTTLPIDAATATSEAYDGLQTVSYDISRSDADSDRPAELSLNDLVTLAGGRLPTGVSPARNPGPFDAEWSVHSAVKIWTADGLLLDGSGRDATILTLSGGGLQTPRSITVRDDAGGEWQVQPDYRNTVKSAIYRYEAATHEQHFWARLVPALLLVAAIFALVSLCRPASAGTSRNPAGRGAPSIQSAKGTAL